MADDKKVKPVFPRPAWDERATRDSNSEQFVNNSTQVKKPTAPKIIFKNTPTRER